VFEEGMKKGNESIWNNAVSQTQNM
jgi:hypothetical protein